MKLVVTDQVVGGWVVPAVGFASEEWRVAVPIIAPIGNSITTSVSGKNRTAAWKVAVATTIKGQRGADPLDPAFHYAITLGFSFNAGAHGNQPLDVENFMKPTLDALAAGLFCENLQDPGYIIRFGYDDSNFKYLFVHRLPDAPTLEAEGVAIIVSLGAAGERAV